MILRVRKKLTYSNVLALHGPLVALSGAEDRVRGGDRVEARDGSVTNSKIANGRRRHEQARQRSHHHRETQERLRRRRGISAYT